MLKKLTNVQVEREDSTYVNMKRVNAWYALQCC